MSTASHDTLCNQRNVSLSAIFCTFRLPHQPASTRASMPHGNGLAKSKATLLSNEYLPLYELAAFINLLLSMLLRQVAFSPLAPPLHRKRKRKETSATSCRNHDTARSSTGKRTSKIWTSFRTAAREMPEGGSVTLAYSRSRRTGGIQSKSSGAHHAERVELQTVHASRRLPERVVVVEAQAAQPGLAAQKAWPHSATVAERPSGLAQAEQWSRTGCMLGRGWGGG